MYDIVEINEAENWNYISFASTIQIDMASLFHLTHDRKCVRNIFLVEPSDVYRKDDNEQVIALVY